MRLNRGGYPFMVSQHVNRSLTEAQRVAGGVDDATAAEELPNDKLQGHGSLPTSNGFKRAAELQPGAHPLRMNIPGLGLGQGYPPETLI